MSSKKNEYTKNWERKLPNKKKNEADNAEKSEQPDSSKIITGSYEK